MFSVDPGHEFGGDWTEQKLAVLRKYLSAYTTALERQPFEKLYIDAFAGTGYRTPPQKISDAPQTQQSALLPELEDAEAKGLLAGSAKIALETDPPFERYVFVERSPNRCSALEGLRHEFPLLADRIDVRQMEANVAIRRLSAMDWISRRAVLFLDPYGAQVEWATIEAVAETRAIDLWILFPLSAVNRMLTRSGKIPEDWRLCLNRLFGTEN